MNLRGQLARFGATGAVNSLVGLAVIYAAMGWLAWGAAAANAAGYVVGVLTSFQLHRGWTFRSRQAMHIALPRYLAAVLVSYLLNLGAMVGASRYLPFGDYFAQLCGVLVYSAAHFVLSREFAFRACLEDQGGELSQKSIGG